jgi:hypothetical protein
MTGYVLSESVIYLYRKEVGSSISPHVKLTTISFLAKRINKYEQKIITFRLLTHDYCNLQYKEKVTQP